MGRRGSSPGSRCRSARRAKAACARSTRSLRRKRERQRHPEWGAAGKHGRQRGRGLREGQRAEEGQLRDEPPARAGAWSGCRAASRPRAPPPRQARPFRAGARRSRSSRSAGGSRRRRRPRARCRARSGERPRAGSACGQSRKRPSAPRAASLTPRCVFSSPVAQASSARIWSTGCWRQGTRCTSTRSTRRCTTACRPTWRGGRARRRRRRDRAAVDRCLDGSTRSSTSLLRSVSASRCTRSSATPRVNAIGAAVVLEAAIGVRDR